MVFFNRKSMKILKSSGLQKRPDIAIDGFPLGSEHGPKILDIQRMKFMKKVHLLKVPAWVIGRFGGIMDDFDLNTGWLHSPKLT